MLLFIFLYLAMKCKIQTAIKAVSNLLVQTPQIKENNYYYYAVYFENVSCGQIYHFKIPEF